MPDCIRSPKMLPVARKMKITDIECYVLLVPDVRTDATSSAQDDIVVFVHTDEGITGIGESDVNPWIARACIEAPSTHSMGLGLKEMLIGENPLDTDRLWQKLYVGSCMNGRRGAVINAIGAIDMALWDIRGKAANKPTWQLLGGTPRDTIQPYASLQPNGTNLEQYRDSLVEWVLQARSIGFRAAKLEITLFGPYNHTGMNESDDKVTEVLAACRKAVGSEFTLMVDVQYAWDSADRALATVCDWAEFDVYFLETPLWVDDLDGYARMHDESGLRIAAGEWQTTRHEFADLMDRGKIDIAQPDVGRVGGLTEAMKVCDMAAERGRKIIPHCWKTGISISASAHLAAVTPHCPYFEYLPAELTDSKLRQELVQDDLQLVNGKLAIPKKPGLGIEINMDALKRFSQG
jgi:L-alanine-DL-glutamate epimerase-like enolase superfamily enzyme